MVIFLFTHISINDGPTKGSWRWSVNFKQNWRKRMSLWKKRIFLHLYTQNDGVCLERWKLSGPSLVILLAWVTWALGFAVLRTLSFYIQVTHSRRRALLHAPSHLNLIITLWNKESKAYHPLTEEEAQSSVIFPRLPSQQMSRLKPRSHHEGQTHMIQRWLRLV